MQVGHQNLYFAETGADAFEIRLWIYLGCSSNWSTSLGCSKHGFATQPPSRAGRGVGQAGVRGPWKFEVCSLSWKLLHAHTEHSDLAASIAEAEKLRQRKNQWPPPNSGEESHKRGLAGVMDDEMGWVD